MSEPIIKPTKSKLASNISVCLPMIEEVTDHGKIPVCVLGIAMGDSDTMDTWFATVNDSPEIEAAVYGACKAFVEIMKDKHECP